MWRSPDLVWPNGTGNTDSMDNAGECRRPLRKVDAIAIIGLLAKLEGLLLSDDLDDYAIDRLRERAIKDAYLDAVSGKQDLSRAIADLNQRVRYALGEYDTLPTPTALQE